jgi:hypothetical protein
LGGGGLYPLYRVSGVAMEERILKVGDHGSTRRIIDVHYFAVVIQPKPIPAKLEVDGMLVWQLTRS